MKIMPVHKIKYGMRLAQNIYRHDGLLALPKGAIVMQRELDIIINYALDYVLVTDRNAFPNQKEDIRFTLNILEASIKNCPLWERNFSEELYQGLEYMILKNKKLGEYLNQLKNFDSYSYVHCINVCMVVTSLLAMDGEVDDELLHIALLTLFHDIGRIKLDKIFNKEGKLTEKEFQQLTKHPEISYKLLKKAGYSEYELRFVLETHEKWDGSGYPYKVKGTEISDLAQIIFIADVYNALSSYRPYRGMYHPYSVSQIIKSERNKSFGSRYVDLFLERFNPYREGTIVELNNDTTGIVKKSRENYKMLPIIEVVSEKTGERLGLVDLSIQKELRIRKIIKSY